MSFVEVRRYSFFISHLCKLLPRCHDSQLKSRLKYIFRTSCKEIRYLLTRTKFVLDEDTERSGGWEEHRPLCEHGSDYPPLGEAHLITLPSYSSSSLSSSHCHLQHHQAESLSNGWWTNVWLLVRDARPFQRAHHIQPSVLDSSIWAATARFSSSFHQS